MQAIGFPYAATVIAAFFLVTVSYLLGVFFLVFEPALKCIVLNFTQFAYVKFVCLYFCQFSSILMQVLHNVLKFWGCLHNALKFWG